MASPLNRPCSIEFSFLAANSEYLPIESHDISTAPLITREAYELGNYTTSTSQYGVLGSILSIYDKSSTEELQDPRLYLNTNTPFSALVCGVQGSGKSHTVSVMLENMTVAGFRPIGSLSKPLSALVLHFGEGGLPSEVAWLAMPSTPEITPPEVRVYCSPSSLNTMRAVYAPVGSNVIVQPLSFSESDLDAEAILSMMAVGSSESAPLYIQVVLTILRGLGEKFTYAAFIQELEVKKKSFNPAQSSGLKQRMSLLTSFLEKKSATKKKSTVSRFAAGRITIIDLSDPFIDPAAACGLFDIITRLFVRADVDTGKVLVVDEAHKYLSSNDEPSNGLSNTLLTLIRQQRHFSMRVIISTQEPTAVPRTIIDLCNVVILHRFSSPAWWEYLVKHVAANFEGNDAFDKVVKLQTGEAIVLAASALGAFVSSPGSSKNLGQWGRRYAILKTRKRVTQDGGASILVIS